MVPDEQLTGLDRWVLGEFSKLETEVIAAYDNYEFHVVYQKVSQFIAVELSSIYHDVIKDRLYTDPANSQRRRSTQTALHRLVTGLSQLLSPILAFTADEAWEFVPGKPTGSVHASIFKPTSFDRSPNEIKEWEIMFELRAKALPRLEAARQAKTIGKSLDAYVLGHHSTDAATEFKAEVITKYLNEFKELLNISQFKFNRDDSNSIESFIVFDATTAEGQKCERCWHWETDIGQNAEHPTLCGRCVEAVKPFMA
jgi:isoleucyl-tRNA synthetase